MNNNFGLSTEDMVEVATVFQEAYTHVLTNLGSSESGKKALQFAGHVVLTEKPYMLVTEEGITHATAIVFSDEVIRDFVFTLHFTFFSRWGRSQERYQALVNNIAKGLEMTGVNGELSAMPEQISQRLAVKDDIDGLLMANPWLVILLLMQLFLVIQVQAQKATTQ